MSADKEAPPYHSSPNPPSLSLPSSDRATKRYTLVLVSTLTTFGTLLLTAYAAWISNSVTLLADFLKCLAEFAAILLAFIIVRATQRLDVSRFNYGLGKIEQLSSVVVAIAMFISSAVCIFLAAERLINPQFPENTGFGFGFAVLSVLGNAFLWWSFSSAQREDPSPVSKSQRNLFFSKTLASGVVAGSTGLGLIGGENGLFLSFDAIGSFLIGLYLLYTGYQMASESLNDLVDHSLEEAFQLIVMRHVVESESLYAGFHGVRTRRVGGKKFIELSLSFHPEKTIAEALEGIKTLTSGIEEEIPRSEVKVVLAAPTAQPVY